MATSYGDTPPPDLLTAFEAYEAALAADDLAALDDAIVVDDGVDAFVVDEVADASLDDEGAPRGDAVREPAGQVQIGAGRDGRGGARRVYARRLGPDRAVLVSVGEPEDGGTGPVTQVWQRCADRKWRVRVAPAARPGPPADSRVWRLLGFPLVAPGASGALDGESVAVKDVFAVAGFPTGAGNPAYLAEAGPEPAHADAVRALLEAGARIRGVARTDEFAFGLAGANEHYGTPPNPRAPRHLPGGSTNGPASAVALGHAGIGLGTDTAGSIRVPASYQGLWGLRSTHGAVSRAGMLALAPSFDTVGWLTRDPRTLAAAARVSLPAASATSGAFALCPALLELADPAVRTAFTARVNAWVRTGALPEPRAIRVPDAQASSHAFRTVLGAEAWRTHGAWLRRHPDALGPAMAARFAWAAAVTADQERAARATLKAVRAHLDATLEDRVLLLPATATPAPRRGADAADLGTALAATISLTCLAAITGRPALSVPCLQADGVPVGLSLVGPRGCDLDLVARAAALAEGS